LIPELQGILETQRAWARRCGIRLEESGHTPDLSANLFREPSQTTRGELGNAACRALASDLRATPRRFEHLPVAELLSCSASLTQRYGRRGFRLVHLWHEVPGRAARSYQLELDRFRFRVGGEIDCRSVTWRQLLAQLSEADGAAPAHLDYLRDRYDLG